MQKVMSRQHHKRIEFVTLQENLSQILDEMLKTGDSVEIEHHGQRFQILPLRSETSVKSANKLDNLLNEAFAVGTVCALWRLLWTARDVAFAKLRSTACKQIFLVRLF